ncbi:MULTISPECIES: VirB4 family type IV secretion/conjugal transfer ATPase [unclassified Acinetobacter]|uniref:VirB4 family type IV secretion/conjugal transfer ATPase n=1 Tax=unclassified Acinetobacter TaxID=196816 RepID=UPI0015D36732|nr:MULTISPECIES: VirB4 family type IV secretion/conjugal transfer ATPase [unclassified Acinetobacter]
MTTFKKAELSVSERSISERIPYSHHVRDNIIVTKTGEYLTTLKLVGRTFLGESPETVARWVYELNTALKGCMTENFAIWTHLDRHKISEFPEKQYNNYFSEYFDKNYSQLFKADNLLANTIYITFIFRPQVGQGVKIGKVNKMSERDRIELQNSYIEQLENVSSLMFDLLKAKKYQPTYLGTYTLENSVEFVSDEDKEVVYCSQLEFLNYLLTRDKSRVPVRNNRISDYIGNHRILFSPQGEFGEIRLSNGDKQFFAMLDVKDYPEATGSGHLNALMKSDFEFMLSQSFVFISKRDSKAFLKQQLKFLKDAKDMAFSQMEELIEAQDDLDSGRFLMGHHYLSLQIFGDSIKQAQAGLNSAYNILTDLQFVLTRCDMSLEGAFFSMLPCNTKYIPRPSPITTFNFLCFNSFHNYATGKPVNNPWGSAIMPLKTTSGSPMYFNFHSTPIHENSLGKKALGNTACFGQSGAGKTVLLGATINHLNDVAKNAGQFIFDKDQGMSVYVQAVNGRYFTVKQGQSTGWNPLQVEDKGFIKDFIKSLVGSDGIGWNHYDDQEVTTAIDLLFKHEKSDRNLSYFTQGLRTVIHTDSDNERPTMSSRLQKWIRGAEYGYLFDNDNDLLDLSTCRVYGFDVGEYIENDVIREPIMSYLLYRSREMLNGQPFVYVFDEFWSMLQAEVFQKLIKDELKTIRKKNGFCFFLTQEPNDVLSHPLAPTLVTQLATLILLENDKATAEHYIEGLKLTHAEFDLVKSIPESSRQFVIKQATQTAVAKLELKGGEAFTNIINVLSGTPDNARLVDKIKQKIGEEKIQKILESELSSEEDKNKVRNMSWQNVKIDSREWLPIYWQTLNEADI